MKIKWGASLVFGILFFIFSSHFLVSQETDITASTLFNENCIEDDDGTFTTGALEDSFIFESGSVTFKEDCQTNLEKIIKGVSIEEGGSLILSTEKSSNEYVLELSGEKESIVLIDGKRFVLKPGDKIVFDKNEGFIKKAKFSIDSESQGQIYDFNSFSFKAAQGNVDFNLDEGFLILPENSVIEDFDNDLFFKKFKNGLIVDGHNIEISDKLFSKIPGDPLEEFKKFSGKIGFGQAEEQVIVNNIPSLKKDADKYFLFIPEKEVVSFPNVGIDIKTGLKKTFVNFGGAQERIVPLGEIDSGFEESHFIIPIEGQQPDYISLGKNEIYMASIGDSEKYGYNAITLTLNENSKYAGFDLKEKGYFSLNLEEGSAFLSQGKINVQESSSTFSIADDGDKFEKRSGEKWTRWVPREGKIGTTPVGFTLLMENKNILNLPNPEYYEKASEKGLFIPSQLIFASYSLDYPLVYLEKNKKLGKKLDEETGVVFLKEAYEKRSEIARYYYNTLFEK